MGTHIDSLFEKHKAFLLKKMFLLLIVSTFAGQGDLPLRVDDAMPRDIGAKREVMQCVAHKSRVTGKTAAPGDLPVGGYSPFRDASNNVPDFDVKIRLTSHH